LRQIIEILAPLVSGFSCHAGGYIGSAIIVITVKLRKFSLVLLEGVLLFSRIRRSVEMITIGFVNLPRKNKLGLCQKGFKSRLVATDKAFTRIRR
jgi:hypothetical protein